MTWPLAVTLAAGVMLGLWVGLVSGLLLAAYLAQHLGARMRTGAASALVREGHTPAPRAHLAEATALRSVVDEAVRRGADEILARNPKMSRKEAEQTARELWARSGDPLGGVV